MVPFHKCVLLPAFQTYAQKRKYRHLKKVVNQSQRQVYRAHAGSIRARPISAPNLSMYATPRETPHERTTSAAAVYQSVQRRLHSAPSRGRPPGVGHRHGVTLQPSVYNILPLTPVVIGYAIGLNWLRHRSPKIVI